MCVCDPLESNGYTFVQWIGSYFGACVYTPADIAGFILGLANIGCWLFVQAPQLYTNYKTKTVEALSFWFLFTWLLGDITNLLGCIYTQQLPVQLYTAIYFCAIDSCLLGQYLYYRYRNKSGDNAPLLANKPSEDEAEVNRDTAEDDNRRRYALPVFVFGSLALMRFASPFVLATPIGHTSRVLLADEPSICGGGVSTSSAAVMVGNVCAWVSGLLYFYSRVPQIQQTHKLKSVEGLSLPMFVMSTFGNIFYTLSIVIPTNNSSLHGNTFWNATLAYLVGSVGPLGLSLIIYWQFWAYRYKAVWEGREASLGGSNRIGYDSV